MCEGKEICLKKDMEINGSRRHAKNLFLMNNDDVFVTDKKYRMKARKKRI